jgi:DNA-binding LytR/AlgR family response regulator
MNTTAALPTCWIIDHNPEAVEELRGLLETQGYGQVLGTSATVAERGGQPVDCLFIRITAWDQYLWWRATRHRQGAGAVIFLSGRYEKCTQQLQGKIDFHLKPPYRATRLAGVLRQISDPDLRRRSLDLFFLKADYRFEPIYFSELLYIRGRSGGYLDIRTSGQEYTVSGTLRSFEQRLPIPWQRVNRSLLVARCEAGPFTPSRGSR